MTLPTPGVDIPFTITQITPDNAWRIRKAFSIAVQNDASTGPGLPLLTATIDDTPRFIASSGIPEESSLSSFARLKRTKFDIAANKNSFSLFPANIPASTFSTISCDLFSEIQRHMLEPTVDGGLTWSALWTKDEVQRYFNERLSRFYLSTGVIQKALSISIAAGSVEYDYPSDLIETKRLTFEENLSLYTNLISFWRLEEVAGTRFDAIGPNHLTPQNTPPSGPGKIGNAVVLSTASTQQLSILDASQVGLNPNLGDFSISFWVNPSDMSGSLLYYMISKGAVGGIPNAEGYSIFLLGTGFGGNGFIGTNFGDNVGISGCQAVWILPSNITNTWNHVVVNFKRSGYIQIYLNNSRMALQPGTSDNINFFNPTTGPCNPTLPFTIGSASGLSSFFSGSIDAVGYWGRVLTTSEISTLYNAGNGRELYSGQHDGPYVVLPRVDPFTQDNGYPGWETLTGTPSAIIEEPRIPLSFKLSPIPTTSGSVEGLYVADPTAIGDACVPLPIPNFLCWGLKYGVMADMLNKEGEANDPKRAQYCESRFQECIQLARLLLGFNDQDADDDPTQEVRQKGKGND